MDDAELLVAIRSTDGAREFGERLADRDLYKRAVWAEMGDIGDPFEAGGLFDADHETITDLERDVAADAGVDHEHVILDMQGEPGMTESTSRVMVNGEVRSLDEQSTLVRALQMAQREQWRFGVYAPAELTERVGKAAERVLGLETGGALISEHHSPGRYASLQDFE